MSDQEDHTACFQIIQQADNARFAHF